MKFENENWAQFKGETWKKEINVRDFIQNNYKPYNGDDTFLVPSSEKTKKVWNKLTEMFKVEREKGVYDAETKLPQGIDTYGPGYIDKENEVIVGLQTDAPLKTRYLPERRYPHGRKQSGSLWLSSGPDDKRDLHQIQKDAQRKAFFQPIQTR